MEHQSGVHVEVRDITVRFGETTALDNVSLTVAPGEFLSILGPSGCGKTTLLNIIAGFLTADTGQVVIGGRDVTDLAPHRRRLSMVFQNYALFPHMTVGDNVGYGLKIRRKPSAEVRARVVESLALVGLSGYEDRHPRQLSGGQQQRVAVARALAVQPEVLLLDEPLSNLDAKLRREMRVELKQLQDRIGATTIFVTHDQEEALSLSDRIAVMSHGRVEQLDKPATIYRSPSTRFVAGFIGQANIFSGTVTGLSVNGSRHVTLECDGRTIEALGDREHGQHATAVVRPEKIRLTPEPAAAHNCFEGVVEYRAFVGAGWQYGVRLPDDGTLLTVFAEDSSSDLPAEKVKTWASWEAADVIILPD